MMKRFSILFLLLFWCFGTSQTINQLEYYYNTDPGFGNGTALAWSGGNSQTYSLNLPNGMNGFNTLYIRAKDNANAWSLYDKATFYIISANQDIPHTSISGLEYFYNTDPGFGNGNPLTASGADFTGNFALNLPNGMNGFNTLYIRSRDNANVWSLYDKATFYILPANQDLPHTAITGLEYFFNTDPGFGSATALPASGAAYTGNLAIEVPSSLAGFNTLYIRSKDNENVWSLYDKATFYIIPANSEQPGSSITQLEYFYNTDPGFGQATSVPVSGSVVEQSFQLPVPEVLSGFNTLYIRAKDNLNRWSLYDKATFYILNQPAEDPSAIVAAEFFIGQDPGVGNATPVDLVPTGQPNQYMVALDTEGIPCQLNDFFLRVQNEDGVWSLWDVAKDVDLYENSAPTILAQNISITLDENDQASITVEDVDTGTYDDCELESVSIDITSFTCANLGENTVTITAEDTHGNTSTQEVIVTVLDETNPVAVGQNATFALNQNGAFTVNPVWINNGSSDNCGLDHFELSQTEFTCEDLGINTITFTAVDASGNESTDTVEITIEDNFGPTVNCRGNDIQYVEAGIAFSLPDYTSSVTFSDPCGMQNVLQSPVAGSELAVGNHLVTITGTDTNGNSTQCNFYVQVMEESSQPGCSPYSLSSSIDSSECGADQFIVHITLNSLGDYESVQITNDVNSNVMNANAAGQVMYGVFNSGQTVNFTATGSNDVTCDDTVQTFQISYTCPDNTDDDNDGIINSEDNCPSNYNPGQEDMDNDGTGDVCDTDADGDGWSTENDCNDLNANINPNSDEINGNGIDENCDGVDGTDPVCYAPVNVAVTEIGYHTADISWTVSNGESAWEFVIVESGDAISTGTVVSLSQPNYSPEGLELETSYDFYIRTDCGNGFYSNWVNESFTTRPPCPAVDIEFFTQEDVDNFPVYFPYCHEIAGNLTINGAGITNLNGLSQIISVGGNINITGSTTLTNLTGMDNISYVGGNITISGNGLTSFTGLGGITTINGNLYVSDNHQLINWYGWLNLSAIYGNFYVYNNGGFSSFSGFGSGGGFSIGGGFFVSGNGGMTGFGMGNLTGIGGDFNVNGNASLLNFNGLGGLTSIGGGLYITGNPSCGTLYGLNAVINLGGCLDISGNSVLIDLSGLSNLGGIGGYLSIVGNGSLTGLDGLGNIDPSTIVSGVNGQPDLEISDNPLLSYCDVETICEFLNLGNTTLAISGNAEGCDTDEQIIYECTYNPDWDGDGILNENDNCPNVANPDQEDLDNDAIGDVCDDDADGDGYSSDDCDDMNAAANPGATEIPGNGVDEDCDGFDGESPVDTDEDGIADGDDNCPNVANPDQEDLDNDGIGDVCDDDADGDGYSSDDCDDLNDAVHPGTTEIPDNGVDEDCDGFDGESPVDTDEDGIADGDDNCPYVANPDQEDLDNDGIGDACDDDADGDGYSSDDCDDMNAAANPGATEIPDNGVDEDCDGFDGESPVDTDEDGIADGDDNCPNVANPDQEDMDNDGIGDVCDDDADGDGYTSIDCEDMNAAVHPGATEIPDNGVDEDCDGYDGESPVDTDEDGIADGDDNCPNVANPDQEDLDNDGIGDACDDDADGDGYTSNDCDDMNAAVHPGATEIPDNGVDENCDGVDGSSSGDSDGDGVDDEQDNCPFMANADQEDWDGDGIGDVCDTCGIPTGITLTRLSDTTATFTADDTTAIYQSTANRAGRPLRPYPMYGMDSIRSGHIQLALIPVFDYSIWFRTSCPDGFTAWVGPYYLPMFDGISSKATVTLTPNPAENLVTVKGMMIKKITLYDKYGRLVLSAETDSNVFNVEKLQTGTYTVHLTGENGEISVQQLIKK